jgi:phosphatidylglycerol:prolipoprotein diacylglycerol transferase
VECSSAWWTVTDARGHARWPAAQLELAFNLGFLVWAIMATRRGWLPEQRFHVYLIGYGVFRFAHEFARDDPRWIGALGGYHVVAVAIVALGVFGYLRRRATRSLTSAVLR